MTNDEQRALLTGLMDQVGAATSVTEMKEPLSGLISYLLADVDRSPHRQ